MTVPSTRTPATPREINFAFFDSDFIEFRLQTPYEHSLQASKVHPKEQRSSPLGTYVTNLRDRTSVNSGFRTGAIRRINRDAVSAIADGTRGVAGEERKVI